MKALITRTLPSLTISCPDGAHNTSGPGHRYGEDTMDAKKSSKVFRGTQDPHPHACYEGWIYMTYTAYGDTVGDEVERIEAIPCRRCAEKGAPSARLVVATEGRGAHVR
jgi:hypothetical protein